MSPQSIRYRPIRFLFLLVCLTLSSGWLAAQEQQERIDFLAISDTQYLAKKDHPQELDPVSKQAADRVIHLLQRLPGTTLRTEHGSIPVPESLHGAIIAGDLVDSLDKYGGPYPDMQKYEWERFRQDYGLTGEDGRVPFPVYELHGNHDGPQGTSFLVEDIVERNKRRPGVVHISENGLHYSWDWGPVHLINLGMFVGKGDEKREGHHYAARSSLQFLKRDLQRHVGNSGRPVIISHHLDVTSSDFDWPDEDKIAYYRTIKPYNVIATIHGHTHADPKMYEFNGTDSGEDLENGVRVFDTGDIVGAKMHKGKRVGTRSGFLYFTVFNRPGVERDKMIVRSFFTDNNWESWSIRDTWKFSISIP